MVGTIVQLWSDVKCAPGAQLLAVVSSSDLISVTWAERIGGNRGDSSLVLRAVATCASSAAIFNVMRIIDTDGAVYEYRIVELDDGADVQTITVTGACIEQDMGRIMLGLNLGGVPTLNFTPGAQTPTSYINTYILPALSAVGITWITLGTITPTGVYTIQWQQQSPLAVMALLEQATKDEFWLQRNGDSGYLLNLGKRLDTSGTQPTAWIGKNVISLKRSIVVDQRFYNRTTPIGAQISGESVPTHMGQHGWEITGYASGVVTLANPQVGGTAPIGEDGQLNGGYLNINIDAIPLHDNTSTSPKAVTYDPTRRVVWSIVEGALSSLVYWYNLNTNAWGTVAVSGSNALFDIAYDSVSDHVFVACEDASKVEYFNPSTHVSAGNVATAANPTTLTTLSQFGVGRIAVGFNNGTTGAQIIDTGLLSVAATLSPVAITNAYMAYDSASTRYFLFNSGSTTVYYYSSAYALLGNVAVTGLSAVTTAGLRSGVLYCMDSSYNVNTLTCSSAAIGTAHASAPWSGFTNGTLPSPASSSINKGCAISPVLNGAMYVNSASYFHVFDTTTSTYPGLALPQFTGGGPSWYDPTDDIFLGVQSGNGASIPIYFRNGTTGFSGRLRALITATSFANQTVTIASSTKGPVLAGQLCEIRADGSDTYAVTLESPSSVATYGPVDAYPLFPDNTYKRNYVRDPCFGIFGGSTSTRPGYLQIGSPNGLHAAGDWVVGDLIFKASDAQTNSRVVTGAVNGTQTFAASAMTLVVKSLPANYVVQAGAVVVDTSQTLQWGFATDRVVADGSGNATITMTSQWGTSSWVNADGISIYAPETSDVSGMTIVQGTFPLAFMTVAGTSTSIALSGLTANLLILAGSKIVYGPFNTASGHITANAQCDGSGNVTVTVMSDTTATIAVNTAFTVTVPTTTISGGLQMVWWPCVAHVGSTYAMPDLNMGVHLPRITGATGAWLRLRFGGMFLVDAANGGLASPQDITLTCGGVGFASTSLNGPNLQGGKTTGGVVPVWIEFVMEQQLTLGQQGLSTGDNFVTIQLSPPLFNLTNTSSLSLYIKQAELYIATCGSCPVPLGANTGDELTMWLSCNALMEGQGRNIPTTNYTVSFLEVDPANPVRIGAMCTLRDPARGIYATPRIVEIQRNGARDATTLQMPTVTLNNRDIYLSEQFADLQAGL